MGKIAMFDHQLSTIFEKWIFMQFFKGKDNLSNFLAHLRKVARQLTKKNVWEK